MRYIKISVNICVKDEPKAVFEAIGGYLKQSLKPYELIIVGDKADKICKRYNHFKIIKPVRFTGEKNDARNMGFLKSSGDFIIFSDHDMIPDKNLIYEVSKASVESDALLIPEFGIKTNGFFNRILCLEKTLVQNNNNSLTPRAFKRNLFSNSHLPFDHKYGKSDEWGFSKKLHKLNPVVKKANTKFYVDYQNYTLKDEIVKKYNMGKDYFNIRPSKNSEELDRFDVTSRLLVYIKQPKIFMQNPLIFIGLIFLKVSVTIFFLLGVLNVLFKNIINK